VINQVNVNNAAGATLTYRASFEAFIQQEQYKQNIGLYLKDLGWNPDGLGTVALEDTLWRAVGIPVEDVCALNSAEDLCTKIRQRITRSNEEEANWKPSLLDRNSQLKV
jgi:hypothetical protein